MDTNYGEEWLLSVAVDVVIFTLRNRDLQVLLVKREGQWSLPGGIIRYEEALEDAANRQLHDQTGVTNIYLQQLYTFGAPDRDSRRRVISVAYFALLPHDRLARDDLNNEVDGPCWYSVYKLPDIAYDHANMIETALVRLRSKIEYSAAAFELMPEEFTLTELQEAYMVILDDRTLDKANFRKKIREARIVEPISRYKETGGRPARLYRFRKDARLESKARRFFP